MGDLIGYKITPKTIMATRESADPSINRKVAFASVASSLGSILSLFLATFLLNLPFLAKISSEDKGTLKTSLTATATGLITLVVGHYTRPGESDELKEQTGESDGLNKN